MRTATRFDALGRISCLLFAAVLSGCGDGFFHDPESLPHGALSSQVEARMGDIDLELLELTGCEMAGGEDLDAPCEGVSDARVEVFVHGRSIIFDFSNTNKTGTISDSEFEGYVLAGSEDLRTPPIVKAVLDVAKSSLDAHAVNIQFDDKRVAVDFRGFRYDDSTFVKVDLAFDERPE